MRASVFLAFSLVAAACGGSEFAADDHDASLATGAGGSTASSSVASGSGGRGSPTTSGSTVGSGGANDAGPDVGGGGRGGSGQGGTGGTGTGGAGGGPKNSGDCLTPADCNGDPCAELFPGGYRVCVTKVPEAMACSNPAGQCCKTSDCNGDARSAAVCVLGPIEPTCGGPVIVPTNVCASDACKTAADCSGPNAICAQAGTLGRKAARCMTGGCRRDSDCTAQPGGICAPVVGACCAQPAGLFCIYQDGCRSNLDCKMGEHCEIDATHAFCMSGIAPCPRAP
jgi:hypothetical protein